MGILKTLRTEVHEGDLVGLIEKTVSGKYSAWLTVFQGIDQECSDENKYKPALTLYMGKSAITLLSDNTIRLDPIQTTLGRVGFHLPKIKKFSKSIIPGCVPEEVHVGEYAIKKALQRFPELEVYARLIDIYPSLQ
jgi:hypothetical protein